MGQTVGRFTDLKRLPYGPNVSEYQDAARDRFRSLLSRPPFSDSIPEHGTYLRIGAASWNGYDMALLDEVESKLGSLRPGALTVSVFDIDECDSPDDIEKQIAGIGPVPQTPALGLWVDGRLVQTASGFDAKQLVRRLLEVETLLASSLVPVPIPAPASQPSPAMAG